MRRLVAATLLLALLAAGCGSSGGGSEPSQQALAQKEATSFLDHFVDPNGRVVRRDQGGDTVSEGQAYGMLLAVAAGDRDRFSRIWNWTKQNLQRDDGLLSWHWQQGGVDDLEPSADADLDAAHALTLAAGRFGMPELKSEALRIGSAIKAIETIQTSAGQVLAAGPWATTQRLANPSYADLGAIGALERIGGDQGWRAVARASTLMVGTVVANGSLPPDWALVNDDGTGMATHAPGSGGAPTYAYDAARVPVRFAASCTESGRVLAARLWPHLRNRPEMLPRKLDGNPAPGSHPSSVGLAAAAASAAAAGKSESAAHLLDRAAAMEKDHPTYFGSALVAITRAGVMTSAFGTCRR